MLTTSVCTGLEAGFWAGGGGITVFLKMVVCMYTHTHMYVCIYEVL